MVVKMMKWRPWPPNCTKKFQVNLTLHSLEGFPPIADKVGEAERLMVDVKWKGPKGALGSRFRRSLKRGRTTDKLLAESGIVTWDEEFEHVCVLSMGKRTVFQPWNVHFIVLQAVQQGTKTKLSVGGTAIMNIADIATPTGNARQTMRIRVSCSVGGEIEAALAVTVNFVELRTIHEALDPVLRIMSPSLPCIGGSLLQEKYEKCGERTGEGKVKNFKSHAAGLNGKKVSGELDMSDDGKLSPRSAESSQDSGELFDSDSVEEYDLEDIGGCEDYYFRKSFSYGTLAGVNLFVEGALPYYRDDREGNDSEEKQISIHSRTVAEAIPKVADEASTSDSDQTSSQPTMRSLLSWKKRKLSFRSPRARGEPLLNKAYGEDGGDDIDFDRRQSGSPIEPLPVSRQKKDDGCSLPVVSGYLDFGDEHFSIGSWEKKTLLSRDGQMRLSTNAFFASIDQRSERAAGESACTALVAVIADWLHRNPNRMPIRAEFDTLIREGSAEWRKLCEIEAYKDRFPDRHFDLDTVLQAEVRPLLVSPERSFIGFFQPEGLGDSCDFLQGAMSFENIWEAIWEEIVSVKPEECFEPAVYIVSWNDHFFVLKVEREAYYIIDTLGERLFEGCNQAYILRFDKEASLCHVPRAQTTDGEKKTCSGPLIEAATSSSGASPQVGASNQVDEGQHIQQEKEEQNGGNGSINSPKLEIVEENVIYEGKEACKQFVKGFFAALPLRELQTDIKKGLMGKVPLHKRLQIEFHYTLLGASKELVAL